VLYGRGTLQLLIKRTNKSWI